MLIVKKSTDFVSQMKLTKRPLIHCYGGGREGHRFNQVSFTTLLFFNFWSTHFVGSLIPLIWTSGDVSSGFHFHLLHF